MPKKKRVDELYKVVRTRLLLNCDRWGRIYEKEIKATLGLTYHVPKEVRHLIIDELILLDYISILEVRNHERIFKVN